MKKIIVLVFVIFLSGLVGCGPTEIILNDYLEVGFVGYDTDGRVEASLNYEALLEDNAKAFGLDAESSLNTVLSLESMLDESINLVVDKNTALSNGDVISMTWTVSSAEIEKQYNLKFVYHDISCNVEGLTALKKYDAFEYFDIAFEGLNGYARAIYVDNGINLGFDYEVSKTENISNGDKITVTVTSRNGLDLNKRLLREGYYIEVWTKDYEVSGLVEPVVFDPFENIVFNCTGISPKASASIIDKNEIWGLHFATDKSTDLSNGDVVTVTVETVSGKNIYEHCAQYGYVPSCIEKEYIVGGLDVYATMMEDISTSLLASMEQQVKEGYLAHIASEWSDPSTLADFVYIGNYFVTPKMGAKVETQNYLYLIFKATALRPSNRDEKFDFYYYACYENLTYNEEGDSNVDIFEYTVPEAKWLWSTWSGEGFEVDEYLYEGYEELSKFSMNHITSKLDLYKYESNVE